MSPTHNHVHAVAPCADALSRSQRGCLVAVVVAGHVAAGWGLMQAQASATPPGVAWPISVTWIASAAEPVAAPPTPQPLVRRARQPRPANVVAVPTPAPAAVEATSTPEPVEPAPADEAAMPVPAAPVALASETPLPKLIPASAVRYLEPPAPDYPAASRRLGEAGRVLVRTYIDEAGLPRSVQVEQSSGHARLDAAAMAAVRLARFKPYTENGRPVAGWALIPLLFDLEQ